MGISALIGRRGSIMRTSNQSHPPRGQTNSLQADLAAGRATPRNTIINASSTDLPSIPSEPTKDISSLRKLWRLHREKFPFLFIKRMKGRQQHGDEIHHTGNLSATGVLNGVQAIEDLSSTPIQRLSLNNSPNALAPVFASPSPGQVLAWSEPNGPCSTESTIAKVGGTLLIVERKQPGATATNAKCAGMPAGTTSNRVRKAREEPETEQVLETTVSEVGESISGSLDTPPIGKSGVESRRDYHPASTLNDPYAEAWIGASLLKLLDGSFVSSKLFYDPGSTDNMITEKLVAKHGFRKHLIRPEDLTIYECAGKHFFTPTHYVEIELMDHEHGIVELKKVSFNVADNLGGWALLVGRKFMFKNNLGMGPTTTPTILVLTARPASDAAKREQARLVERNLQHQHQASHIMTGSWRSAASSSLPPPPSSGQGPPISSRTSTSSITRVEDPKK